MGYCRTFFVLFALLLFIHSTIFDVERVYLLKRVGLIILVNCKNLLRVDVRNNAGTENGAAGNLELYFVVLWGNYGI